MSNRPLFAALACATAMTTAPPVLAQGVAAQTVCIENAGDEELVFVAEAIGGERVIRRLAPGASLCAKAPEVGSKGVVGVFESEDAIEGCSRSAVAGTPERLVSYSAFDNCTWAER